MTVVDADGSALTSADADEDRVCFCSSSCVSCCCHAYRARFAAFARSSASANDALSSEVYLFRNPSRLSFESAFAVVVAAVASRSPTAPRARSSWSRSLSRSSSSSSSPH